MRLMFDIFTVVIFFASYKLFGIYNAVAIAMGLYTCQVIFTYIRFRRVEPIQWFALVLIVGLGGATLFFHNETFFKWKPTAVYWLFAVSLYISRFFSKGPLLRKMIGQSLDLSDVAWYRLQASWAWFFILMGGVNLYVVYNFSTDVWVNFKLFGLMGITLGFVMIQGLFLSHHIKKLENKT